MGARGPIPSIRLPVEPLWDYVARNFYDHVADACTGEIRPGNISLFVGGHRTNHRVWIKSGGIPLHRADRICADLNIHPTSIWPDFHDRKEDQQCLSRPSTN